MRKPCAACRYVGADGVVPGCGPGLETVYQLYQVDVKVEGLTVPAYAHTGHCAVLMCGMLLRAR
eukprot:3425651-Rhodomonas_salina.1